MLLGHINAGSGRLAIHLTFSVLNQRARNDTIPSATKMSKKAFSTAANLAKSITWAFRGTTEDVGGLGYLKAVEDAAANIPALAAKVTKGEIM